VLRQNPQVPIVKSPENRAFATLVKDNTVSDELQPIIVKKIKKSAEAAHGGAWKVAYADFVTAMMAFFLLMWLLNMTSPEQKRGIADYFAPASVSKSQSGSGGLLAGNSFSDSGARSEARSAVTKDAEDASTQTDADAAAMDAASGATPSTPAIDSSQSEYNERLFNQAEQSLRQAMKDMPELAELSKHILIDRTPEGLRIQIVDQEGRPMFAPGSIEPYRRTRHLIQAIATILNELPNRVSISGHTDSSAFYGPNGYTNWELSADRANATRRVLMDNEFKGDRVYMVSGKAGSEPLFPDDPFVSANRRISIVLLREAPVMPPDHRP
jgi:chemotaxis protein MotB